MVRMLQQKSTSFSAAKVANFGVVMAEMMGKMSEIEKEIKTLRHHVSVLSKRNHQLMKHGKSRAASPIAGDVSLRDEEGEEEDEGRPGKVRVTIVATEEQLVDVVIDAGIGLGLIGGVRVTEWVKGVGERGVEAESVALVEEAEVAEPVVRLPVAVKGEGVKREGLMAGRTRKRRKRKRRRYLSPRLALELSVVVC